MANMFSTSLLGTGPHTTLSTNMRYRSAISHSPYAQGEDHAIQLLVGLLGYPACLRMASPGTICFSPQYFSNFVRCCSTDSMAEPHNHDVGYKDSLTLTTSICLTYTLCVTILRAWIRRSNYGLDDVVIAIATLICLGHFACNYVAIKYGAGAPWSWLLAHGNVHDVNEVCLVSRF